MSEINFPKLGQPPPAGDNVSIVATGAGKASNIDIVGSDVRAAGKALLAADNQVNLLTAQNSEIGSTFRLSNL